MNIKFGMDNFYVRYLKRFLNYELSKSTSILGKFDKNDLKALIQYLNLPNVKGIFEVQKEIIQTFPQLENLFNMKIQDTYITWTSKYISTEHSTFLSEQLDNIRNYCESVGWQVSNVVEWVDISKDLDGDGVIGDQDRQILYNIVYNDVQYNEDIMDKADINRDGVVNSTDLELLNTYISSEKLSLTIEQTNRTNYFPNQDMLVFINQFTGSFMYGYTIRDENVSDGYDDVPHKDSTGLHKIALYECKPGQKITIAHNSKDTQHLIIGCSAVTLKQNLTKSMLENVVEIDLKSGEGYEYTCTSVADGTGYDAKWVCIQCASNYGNLTGEKTVQTLLPVGDINFDGQIDMLDYHLLARYTATGPGSEQYHWNPTPKQLAVMNVDTTNPDINVEDAIKLKRFIEGTLPVPSLGNVIYEEVVNADYEGINNVENFLIIDGHYDRSVNIPFSDFVSDDWIIHEKFFNYLLGMAIHKYSSSENISYLQKLLKEAYPEHSYDPNYFYPGYYNDNMKNTLKQYQLSKVHYTTGDLNMDNKLTSADLTLLRNFLDDTVTLNLITNYLEDPEKYPLTDDEKTLLDVDNNGIVDKWDKEKIEQELYDEYREIFRTRADINQDGFWNETDYVLLQNEIAGKTDNLKKYDISFMLGWLDVQTEYLLETDVNYSGNISEVSK